MADFADVASDYTEKQLEHSLAQHAARAASQNKESAFYCIDCDDVIPHPRREAIRGVQMCISCQSIKEIKKARGI